jgi:hypothetical protein
MRAAWLVAAALLLAAPLAPSPGGRVFAQEQEQRVLVLKDGRRIAVTRLLRRGGQVLFETTRGERFSVPEADVVSPPLASIPEATPPAAPDAAPTPQVLVLKDGRRIPVVRLVRRGGQVLLQTAAGEAFSVPESDVVEPALDSIPVLDGAPAPGAPPAPEAPPPTPDAPAPAGPIPPPSAPAFTDDLPDFEPFPDRWEVPFPDDPRIVKGRLLDPYNQNVLKGDKPVIGDSIFFSFTGTLDSPFEARRLPVPGGVSTADPGTFEFFGRGEQLFLTPRALFQLELFRGQTAFKPKKWAIRVTPAVNVNYLNVRERNLVNVDVREGTTRRRQQFSLEEAFLEYEILDFKPYYDSISVRAGIQPFVSDPRGLLFSDFNLGVRLFGNAGDNRWQYNVAWFDLLEKETNSELNLVAGLTDGEERRGQQVFIANVFRQDFLTLGYTSQASVHVSNDEPSVHYDENGFLVRPAPVGVPRVHAVRSRYLGWTGDGHLGALNLSHAAYYAFGTDELNVVAGQETEIRAFLGAVEASVDRDWLRFKASALFASGDGEPLDDRASGFDSIYDNSNFAGGPFSFWSRSAILLTQTKVFLKGPNSLLPNLRSNKFEGQASFVNPGLQLVGLGVDVELTPKLRMFVNGNYLRFAKTEVLEALLFQPDIRKGIGLDLGLGFFYRPLLSENVSITAGLTALLPGAGFDDIFASGSCGTAGCGFPSRKLYNAFALMRLQY